MSTVSGIYCTKIVAKCNSFTLAIFLVHGSIVLLTWFHRYVDHVDPMVQIPSSQFPQVSR
jgi:hypothetical protein